MENPSRKASEILIDLEGKVEQLTNLVRTQDLNLKILSNKLNLVLDQLKEVSRPAPAMDVNQYLVSAEDGQMPNVLMQNRISPPVEIIKVSKDTLPMVQNPEGFRRTSRTEPNGRTKTPPINQTQQQRKVSIQDSAPPDMSQFIQPPQFTPAPMPTPPTPVAAKTEPALPAFKEEPFPIVVEGGNKVAVIQRVTEKSGKSIFLAEVEIFDLENNLICKVRTNGVGKWQAPLAVGTYKVRISKRESVTKQKIEKEQRITVDGRVSQLNLDQLIIDK